jgi:PAS domain S-box-containing protein
MNWLSNLPIRRKLLVILMMTSASSLLVAGTLAILIDRALLRRTLVEHLTATADILAANTREAIPQGDGSAARHALRALRANPRIVVACVFDQGGHILASYAREGVAVDQALPGTDLSGHRFTSRTLEMYRPVVYEGEMVGRVYLRSDLGDIRTRRSSYLGIVGLSVGASLVLALLLSIMLQRVISQPIRQLTGIMRKVSDGQDFSLRAVRTSGDELGELVDRFNEMLSQIERRDEDLKQAAEQLERRVQERTRELIEEAAQRRLSDAKLQVSERHYRDLVETSNDLIWSVDAEGRWTFLNRGACRLIYGREPEEMIGHPFTEVLPPDQRAKDLEVFERIKGGEPQFAYETVHLRKDGTPVHLSFNAIVLRDKSGRVMGSTGTASDITVRQQAMQREHELQARLARAERMESLGLLAGGVAHDLNNILGPVVGYPDLLLEELAPDSPLRADLVEIRNSAKRAAAVIQDLLTLSRRGGYQTEAVALDAIVQDHLNSASFREFQRLFPTVTVRVELHATPLMVMGSVPHLTQVIMNLTNNAFEAMPHGGVLTLSTATEYIDRPFGGYDNVEEGDYVVLRVRDTGAGIDPRDMAHIFEPFYTKKKMGRSGTGLGLAVVYGVVKDLKGYIDVKSELGRGAEFTLYFPVARQLQEVKSDVRETLSGNERILVVDDVPEQRTLASRLLGSLGYRVEVAESGRRAVDLARTERFNLAIIDMIMEDDFDGLDTFKAITALQPDLPCILASGFSESERVKEALRCGVLLYVRKPYTVEVIARAARKALDLRRARNITKATPPG